MDLINKILGPGIKVPPPDPDGLSREELYVEIFGPIASVSHDTGERSSHTVYRFDAREGRNFVTYVTGGMSKQEQPGMAGEQMARMELVFYATAHSPLYAELLREFAHYPFNTGRAFKGWDALSLGSHAAQVLGSDRFQLLWFCPGLRKEDLGIVSRLTAAGHPVFPLMIVPLTKPESEFLQEQGVRDLVERISASSVSIVYDPARESVI